MILLVDVVAREEQDAGRTGQTVSSHSPRRSIPRPPPAPKSPAPPQAPPHRLPLQGARSGRGRPHALRKSHHLRIRCRARASAGSVAVATAMADRLLPHEPGSRRDRTRGTRSWLRSLGELSLWRPRARTGWRAPAAGGTPAGREIHPFCIISSYYNLSFSNDIFHIMM